MPLEEPFFVDVPNSEIKFGTSRMILHKRSTALSLRQAKIEL
jgi:hypothetical protein